MPDSAKKLLAAVAQYALPSLALFISLMEYFLVIPLILLAILLWYVVPAGKRWKEGAGSARALFGRALARASVVIVVSVLFIWGVGGFLLQAEWWIDARTSALAHSPLRYAPAPSEMSVEDAARHYEPIWVFSKQERWLPSSVDNYLRSRDAELRDRGGETVVAVHPSARLLARRSGSCSAKDHHCFVLTIGCPQASKRCASDVGLEPIVYVRAIRRGDPTYGEDAALLDRPTPVGRVETLLQYWLFYRYDDWTSLNGTFHQWHEADWESVTVGLGHDAPLFVAYSAHCGGSWRPWDEIKGGIIRPIGGPPPAEAALVDVAPEFQIVEEHADVWDGPHPLVYVAEGSHANYPDAFTHASDWASCKKLRFPKLVIGPTYTSGVRETMRFAGNEYVDEELRDLGPRIERLRSMPPREFVSARTEFMQLQGTWGRRDRVEIASITVHEGDGPETPTLKALWKRPLHQIFCGKYWEPPAWWYQPACDAYGGS